jgi:hypothetical protein
MDKEQKDKENDELVIRVRSYLGASLREKSKDQITAFIKNIDINFLKELHNCAIENEDYEVCEIIKKILDERKQ